VTGLLRRASLRFYLRHPWQLGLAIAGISLGVGVHVGVGLANDSAARAFDVAATAVRGAVTHRLLPLDGALDENLYSELVVRDGTVTAAPVVEGEVGIAGRPRLRVPLLGIDMLLGAPALRMAQVAPSSGSDIARLVAEAGTVLLPEELTRILGVASGDSLTLTVGGREASVQVIGTVQAAGSDIRAEPPIVADIATAQELLARHGYIDRVDLSLTDSQQRTLAAALPAGTVVVAIET
jgi:putative ABC transport system permease protein